MPPRLTEVYRLGQAVELKLRVDSEDFWQLGEVVAFEHPGVWVRAADDHLWFVTNRRHIRPPAGPARSHGP